jgi:hypothetical protein
MREREREKNMKAIIVKNGQFLSAVEFVRGLEVK